MNFKKCFQYRYFTNAHDYYIGLETIFEYEHSARHTFSENTRDILLNEIDNEEFSLTPLENRLIIQDVEDFLNKNQDASLDAVRNHFIEEAKAEKCNNEENIKLLFNDLAHFLQVKPQLPPTNKQFEKTDQLNINVNQSRLDILNLIASESAENEVALLSLYAYRQLDQIDWKPFVKAALERNPVSIKALEGKTPDAAYRLISAMPDESVYDGKRLAQPDEVWNFGRGDGVEKALLLANFLYNELNQVDLSLIIDKAHVTLGSGRVKFSFNSTKNIVKRMNLVG